MTPQPKITPKPKPIPVKVSPKKKEVVSPPVNQQAPIRKREKCTFSKVIEIVKGDIKHLFRIDDKTKEDEMKYREFMERFGKS